MSTHQQPPSQPEVPAELWMLWNPRVGDWVYGDGEKAQPDYWVVFASERKATEYARWLHADWGISVTAARVK